MIRKLNLQFFAASKTTDSGLSAENKTYYDGLLLDNATPKLVYKQFGDHYPIPKSKTAEFRKYTALAKATTALTEGVTPAGKNLAVTTVTATVSQYGDFIQMSDLLEIAAVDDNVSQATKELGRQAGMTLDTVVRDILMAGTNVMYAPKDVSGTLTAVSARNALDATAKLTPDLILQAEASLKAMNVDTVDDCYVAIIHPYVSYDLKRNSEWMDWQKYTNPERLYQGEIGKIGSVRFVESSEAKIWTGTSCPSGLAVFGTLVLGAHAYADIDVVKGGLQHFVKPLGYGEDPLNQRSACGWKATQTAVRLSEDKLIRIESCGKYSATATAN